MSAGRGAKLSNRELQVMQWLAHGKLADEVAELVGSSRSAVYSAMNRVKNKLGAQTITGAVCIVLRDGKIK